MMGVWRIRQNRKQKWEFLSLTFHFLHSVNILPFPSSVVHSFPSLADYISLPPFPPHFLVHHTRQIHDQTGFVIMYLSLDSVMYEQKVLSAFKISKGTTFKKFNKTDVKCRCP